MWSNIAKMIILSVNNKRDYNNYSHLRDEQWEQEKSKHRPAGSQFTRNIMAKWIDWTGLSFCISAFDELIAVRMVLHFNKLSNMFLKKVIHPFWYINFSYLFLNTE